MALTGLHTVADYKEALKAFIAKYENYEPKFYSDGAGVPTIGMGYALTKHSNWFSDFTEAGISLTSAQKSAIEALYTYALSHTGDNAAVKSYITTTYSKNAISLTPNQNSGLFLAIKQKYEDQAIAIMGDANKNTKEFITLVDIAYNMGSIGKNIKNAIQHGNRAEAWYEIRYNSNNRYLSNGKESNSYKTVGVGIANRRIAQSDYLGLYSNNPTEDDYKQIMRMFTLHRSDIDQVEQDSYAPPGNNPRDKNGNLIYPPLKTIGGAYTSYKANNEISPARNYLISKYGEGVSIDGDVQVGKGGSETYDYLEPNYNDTNLTGTSKNDLIFGERGADYIDGLGGDDVLYGGQGSDQLIGGSGYDILMGTDGNGTDDGLADTLNGGAGFDTYVAGNNDVIYDSDGLGMIVFEGKLLKGVDVTMDSTIYPSNQDHTAYYSKADKGTYYRNGNYGFSFVSDSGKTLTVYSPLDYTEKIIPKPGGGTMTQKTYRGVGVILENFSSPLVLDLNHDGVTSLDLYATPAYFDMEGDGIREKTGWIQSTDALLAFDKNRDGIINDGSELFGNNTTLSNGTKASNGFEALEQYDNNQDGVIDTNDTVYAALNAWIDSDQDGITDSGELHSLSELGITSISLSATETSGYEDQNAITHTSTFTQQTTDADGNTITETKTVNDVWFRKDTTNTLSTVTISDDIAALPQINGSGRVLDLHGAMQERTALKTAVEAYLTSTATYADQTAAIKNILALWSNTDNISTTQARGEQWILNHNYANAQPVFRYRIYAYARDVAILEQFAGTTFSMTTSDGKTTNDVVDSQMAQEMSNRLNDLIDTTMIRLLGQKIMGDAFYDTTGQADYEAMFTAITSIMESGIQSDNETAATLIAAIIHRDGFESLNFYHSKAA